MHFGFVIFRYFPFGGLQRDMLSFARTCIKKGHELTIFTREWIGDRPEKIKIIEIPSRAIKSRKKDLEFCNSLKSVLLNTKLDLVIGFNKTPHLDVYFCGDTCYAEKTYKKNNFFYRYTSRCRQNIFLEKMVFEKNKKTQIITIEPNQKNAFITYYKTEQSRFHYISPGIDSDRIAPENRIAIGCALRKTLNIHEEWNLITLIGSNLALKGVNRALNALHSLPEVLRSKTLLLLVGDDKKANPHLKRAKKMGLEHQVRFIGPRKDIPQILFATDILIHPAHREAAGNVILEGAVAGVPVLCSGICGFSPYISKNNLGKVVEEPFDQKVLNNSLLEMLSDIEARAQWKENTAQFAMEADIYNRSKKFVECLEGFVRTTQCSC